MALYVRDPEVDRLAGRLAMLRRISKTEAVKAALRNELDREEAVPSLIEQGLEFARQLRARGDPRESRTERQGVHRQPVRRQLMFVDASALTAILSDEKRCRRIAGKAAKGEGADHLAASRSGKR